MEKKINFRSKRNKKGKVKINLPLRLLLLIVVILIILIGFVLYNSWPLLTGTKIVLDTMPVDPFDPFLGQYIVINYEISSLNNTIGLEKRDNVYVFLSEDNEGIWRPVGTYLNKPDSGIFIKGKVTNAYRNTARVEYGIERYYFERNANIPTRNLTVEVIVGGDGRAKISQLLSNGKPIKF